MVKRKGERFNSKIRRKIRHLEQKLRDSSTSTDDEEYDCYYPRPPTPKPLPLSSQSDLSDDDNQIRSCVVAPAGSPGADNATDTADVSHLLPQDPGPSSSDAPNTAASKVLPPEILDALGDTVVKEEVLGPAINSEIAKRWDRVMVEGMTKEAKEATMKKILIPENFSLSKAPKLNLEISAVLSDSIKHRDKLVEKTQNQLGLGIAGLANLASSLIEEDLTKVEILKRLSEVSQIFLDLHNENTKHRRKLIATSLDKKFSATITDVKRDSFLFGANLGEKIKATKTAERSGLQIRRSNVSVPSTSRQQGNWRGPPRYQPTKAPKPGGQRPGYSTNQMYSAQQGRKPPPTTNRARPAMKTDHRAHKNH